eukprot:COSAG01_NODE_9461_length_2441_cov_1.419300_5_plen_79_part_00
MVEELLAKRGANAKTSGNLYKVHMNQEAQALFRHLDVEKANKLSSYQLYTRLSDFGLEDEQIDQIALIMDADMDGEVS